MDFRTKVSDFFLKAGRFIFNFFLGIILESIRFRFIFSGFRGFSFAQKFFKKQQKKITESPDFFPKNV